MQQPELRFFKSIGGLHGVSAIFPKFQDVIDYEENKIAVLQAYPRFVTHPIIKLHELTYKKKFKATGAISFHSYESAVFFTIDFLFKKENKIYFDEGLPSEIYSILSEKFPKVIEESDSNDAEYLILNGQEGKFPHAIEGKKLIGLLGSHNLSEPATRLKFEILIIHDKDNDIGIILFFGFRYLMLTILRRHIGFNVSSRKMCRRKKIPKEICDKYELHLKEKISNLEHGKPENCFLYPSGMAAIFISIFSILSKNKSKIIAIGSLYVDTIRILERWPKNYDLSETIFIYEDIVENLKKNIDDNTAGVIIEIPSNPLIQLVDVDKIIEIAHSKNAKVIIDNTIATPYNFNPFDYGADIIVHSTTKFLSGKNNHIGGALILKDDELSNKIDQFNNIININMPFDDLKTLTRNLRTFEKRMKKINSNSEKIAEFLNNHKKIKEIYYPSLKTNPSNELFKKYLKGGSGVISFVLRESTEGNAESFYDNLLPPILKGPSLGSEKSLLCPYVIMAHYDDSKEELEQLGFDFYLMRLSVGIEPVEKIINSLNHALEFVK